MAMNKTEQAMMEQLCTEVAFRWPTEAEPEPQPVPQDGEALGWTFNAYSLQVEEAWSRSVTHGYFHHGDRISASQGGKRLYRTKRDALVALRWALCRRMASHLRAVDRRIEIEGKGA